MATAATLRKVDVNLLELEAETDFLPELVEEWNDMSESSQASWVLEWMNLLDGLNFLTQAHSCGDMTPAQQARYETLMVKLKESAPILKRLELSLPKVLT